MTKRAFANRNMAYSKIKQGQRVVKRKSRAGRTIYILRKCKHFYTGKSSRFKGKPTKNNGSRQLHRRSGKRKQRSKK